MLRRLLADGIAVERVAPVASLAGGPVPGHDHPTGGPCMIRLIRAEILKLRRRPAWSRSSSLLLASRRRRRATTRVDAPRWAATGDFDDIVGHPRVVGLGGGVDRRRHRRRRRHRGRRVPRPRRHRPLAALALFFVRVPGAWAIVLPPLVVAVVGAALLTRAPAGRRPRRLRRCSPPARWLPPSASAWPRSPARAAPSSGSRWPSSSASRRCSASGRRSATGGSRSRRSRLRATRRRGRHRARRRRGESRSCGVGGRRSGRGRLAQRDAGDLGSAP